MAMLPQADFEAMSKERRDAWLAAQVKSQQRRTALGVSSEAWRHSLRIVGSTNDEDHRAAHDHHHAAMLRAGEVGLADIEKQHAAQAQIHMGDWQKTQHYARLRGG